MSLSGGLEDPQPAETARRDRGEVVPVRGEPRSGHRGLELQVSQTQRRGLRRNSGPPQVRPRSGRYPQAGGCSSTPSIVQVR